MKKQQVRLYSERRVKMKLRIDKQKRRWLYAFATVGLVFLCVGLGVGVGVSHGRLSRVAAFYPLHNTAAQEAKPITTPQGLPDFVSLAKKLKPEVVNISTTQNTKELDVPSPFGENDPFGEFQKRF